ncbi:MAG: hypothetical protein K8T91_27260 [Planctomycetes bacterium]|nr:hypothetical protein [Planctomycetota bacterium]
MTLAWLIFVGGLLHFSLLSAGATAAKVLDWPVSLAKLDPLNRQLIWVHGAFIVMVIVAFGAVSVLMPTELTDGTLLARAVCGFIAFFWGVRLGVQLFFFDAKAHLTSAWRKLGYRALTAVFTYLTVAYAAVAVMSRG